MLRLGNPKAPSKGKRYLLTSYNVNDVTERAPRDENGNATLMAQGAKQDFFFAFCNSTNAPIVVSIEKQGANYVYTHFNTQ